MRRSAVEGSSALNSRVTSACDSCRKRKVRCDAGQPCARCKASHQPCAYNAVKQRRGPKVSKRLQADDCVILSGGPEMSNSHDPDDSSIDTNNIDERRDSPQMAVFEEPVFIPRQNSFDQEVLEREGNASLYLPSDGMVVQQKLLADVTAKNCEMDLCQLIQACIDIFMQYHFPINPLVHEPSLRFFGSSFAFITGHDSPNNPIAFPTSYSNRGMKAFTLTTTLCATVMATMPHVLPDRCSELCSIFLRAARQMLHLYEEEDLEYPDSTSLSTRMLLSSAQQNLTGRSGAAWHHHGEAALLASRAVFYDEVSHLETDEPERTLFQNCFWQIFASDSTATAFANRPVVMHRALWPRELSFQDNMITREELLDVSRPFHQGSFERHLMEGFKLQIRLNLAVADFMFQMKANCCQNDMPANRSNCEHSRKALSEAYFAFTGMLDHLPDWLQNPDVYTTNSIEDHQVAAYQSIGFWAQRCNLLTAFHCYKLLILQQCITLRKLEVMGLANDEFSVAAKKLEMIHEFLQVLKSSPFSVIQCQGEPMVEKIRRVGVILLEIANEPMRESVAARSNTYLSQLLEILSRLDSKASDMLASKVV